MARAQRGTRRSSWWGILSLVAWLGGCGYSNGDSDLRVDVNLLLDELQRHITE